MPDPDATFKHAPLDKSTQQIRLISIVPIADSAIQCNVKHFDLSANPDPECQTLSYT